MLKNGVNNRGVFLDYSKIDPTQERTRLFTDYGTTTLEGRKLFEKMKHEIRPLVFHYCQGHQPHELNMLMQAVMNHEFVSYAAALYSAHRKLEKRV